MIENSFWIGIKPSATDKDNQQKPCWTLSGGKTTPSLWNAFGYRNIANCRRSSQVYILYVYYIDTCGVSHSHIRFKQSVVQLFEERLKGGFVAREFPWLFKGNLGWWISLNVLWRKVRQGWVKYSRMNSPKVIERIDWKISCLIRRFNAPAQLLWIAAAHQRLGFSTSQAGKFHCSTIVLEEVLDALAIVAAKNYDYVPFLPTRAPQGLRCCGFKPVQISRVFNPDWVQHKILKGLY